MSNPSPRSLSDKRLQKLVLFSGFFGSGAAITLNSFSPDISDLAQKVIVVIAGGCVAVLFTFALWRFARL